MTPVLKGFVRVPHGQVHFRYGGRGPVVVLLHDSPRSSLLHVPNVEWLGDYFTVIALDTPGYGESTALPGESPAIADFSKALATTLSALGIERCAIYGFHTGAKIALQFAADHPERAALTLLDGLALGGEAADAGFLARYLPPFEPVEDGSHLALLWTQVLDFHRYFPWFERTAQTRVPLALPEDAALHEYATDVLAAGRHWDRAYGAALRYQAAPAIASLRSRTVFMAREDDVLYPCLAQLPQPLPAECSVERIAPLLPAWRTRLLELLRHAGLPPQSWSPPAAPAAPATDNDAESRRYVDLVHGQVHVRLRGRRGAMPPVLLLHDPPGCARALSLLAAGLATDRLTVCPDLPGLGDSHPLPYPSLGSYTTALVETLEALGLGAVDVVAEGLGTCFAVALAAHHPTLVRRVALDAVPMVRTRQRRYFVRNYGPPIAPDRHGTQLQRIWHQLRDGETSWPWFERSATAARLCDPDLDPERLHARLLAVMKQLPSYGDAARAALDGSVRDILRGVHQNVLLFETKGDVRYADTRRAARRLAAAEVVPRPAGATGRARRIAAFLD
jgi:pimeloyl-ACP methyl ester carboxylesterase